ncbi:MAG: glutathione S-transferase N-terminal domain-containing protein [Thermoleophilaceae bacterium]
MRATLFGIPASHPVLAAELMLRHKRIAYRRIDLVSALHRVVLRALGFQGVTVPAVRIDSARVQGTTDIARALDALAPSPPLFPSDPERLREVEAANAWGDEVLQPIPRRMVWNALKHDRSTAATYLEGQRMGVPTGVAARLIAPVALAARLANHATDENARRDLAALPRLLDHVDELIERGVIGGTERNVADFQIATSVSMLLTIGHTRPLIEGRPAERLALDVVPHQVGHVAAAHGL